MNYYKGIVTFEYASDTSLKGVSLAEIIEYCQTGGGVRGNTHQTEKRIGLREATRLAVEYGSEEHFFGGE